jgi:putative PIN family toxin of toxin-antitoxin system
MIRLRVVLDTNVIVAGVSSKQGASYQLLKEIPAQSFTLLVSVPLFVEYEATLNREEIYKPHGLSHQDVDVLLEVWAKVCEAVSLNFLWPQLRDTGDEMVLETAVNGSAQAIVTFNIADFRHACSRFGVELVQDRPQSWIVATIYSCILPIFV